MSLRARMVLLAAAGVTAILLLGGVLVALGVREALIRNELAASRLRGSDLAALAAEGALPDPIPIRADDEALVQVVAGGRVLAASANIRTAAPLDLPAQPPGTERVAAVDRLPVEPDESGFRVVAVGVDSPDGPATVYVALSLEEVTETVAAAARVSLSALPVLVLLLAGGLWIVVGATLRPVEAIRAEAEAVSGDDLSRRVPEPARRDEIGRLARTVNAMLARVQRSAERQRRFVADAAHELRSPVASIRAQVETARDSARPVDWDDVSADVLHETLRMQQLTEQLLLLARVDADRLPLHLAPVDLDDLVDGVVERRAEGPRVDRSAVLPVQVAGDPLLLEQAVGNLVDNALRHGRAHVAVGLHREDGVAVLTVDDDGPGIPAEQRDAVFERFTRLDDARDRRRGGAGLGLAIVAEIVRAHAGTVEALASGLGGARLRVTLPLHSQQTPTSD